MENSFKSIVDQAQSILVLLPVRPFFDQAAAGLSLYLSLRDKKEVQIASPNPLTVEFNRLVGVNKITQELGSKNLVVALKEYDTKSVERVSADIKNNEFYLTVIPKPGSTAPSKDQVALSYSGVSADTVILVGGTNDTHFPAVVEKDLAGAKLVHVGIKDITITDKDIISFARPASTVSEVVADTLKQSEFALDEDIATNLLMGIEEGSRKFSGNDVTADTFAIIAGLMRAGGRRQVSIPARAEYPQGAIPGQMPLVRPQPQMQQQATQSPVQQQTQSSTRQDQEQESVSQKGDVPKSWLQPKVFKGTSIK
jgi:hypothetical protein